jgi:hypothetical protein
VEPLAARLAEDSDVVKFSADFESGFFLELASGCGKRILVRIEDSLGYRPCALVLFVQNGPPGWTRNTSRAPP